MKSISIKDIARKANVSITTVSFILNGKAKEKSISAAVIQKVEKIIHDNDYQPNSIAQSLRTGNTNTIALMVEDISNTFFSKIARLIEDKAYKKGYKIIYSSTENNVEKAVALLQMFKSRKVDGYIISPIKGLKNEIQSLIKDQIPVVLFDRNLPELGANYVGANHFLGAYTATKSLIDKGKQSIAFVTIDIDVQQIKDRLEGYQQALFDHHFPIKEALVLKIPFHQEEAQTISAIKNLLSQNAVDAILFATNYLTISGLKAIKELGIPLNEQLEFIGYDDHEVFELHSPSISAIKQPLDEIADNIIHLILIQLEAKSNLPSKEIVLPAQLIVRG